MEEDTGRRENVDLGVKEGSECGKRDELRGVTEGVFV